MTLPFITALLASILHVISGPDHLAAVTPLVIETKRKAWIIGLSWGLGHILGMLTIGVLFLSFKDVLPIKSISSHSEQFVALVLIGIGGWMFAKIFLESKQHKHPHVHTENEVYIHVHIHDHTHHNNHQHTHSKETKQNIISSLGIGFLHGLAGVAHFLLLLPILGFENKIEGIEYIIGFVVGTVIAMTSYTFVLSQFSSYIKEEHSEIFFKGIRFAGGLFAIIIGFYWLYLTF